MVQSQASKRTRMNKPVDLLNRHDGSTTRTCRGLAQPAQRIIRDENLWSYFQSGRHRPPPVGPTHPVSTEFRRRRRRRPVQRLHPGCCSRPRAKTHKICHITLASMLTTKRSVLVSWNGFLPNILCLPASSLLCFGLHYCAVFQNGAFFATYFRACGSIA